MGNRLDEREYTANDKIGYHFRRDIPKARYGTFEKIIEEFAELRDAKDQNCKLMVLQEMSDLIGAMEGYLIEEKMNITIDDLIKMKDITKRVFENGRR
jgi:phosphoribosyl-ATP pyrophosphohydrolase